MRRLLPFALTLLLAFPAQALILDSGDGQGNTSPPVDDPGWSHVGRIGGPAGIYLGNGWVLTANHVILSDPEFQNVIYPIVPGSVVQLQNPDASFADLKIFRINPSPNLGLLKLRASTPALNATVTYIARGLTRGAATSWMGNDGYLWGVATGMRWGTNKRTDTGTVNNTFAFSTTFNEIPGGGSTTHEAMGADGDSGGAVFIKSGVWELAGVLTAVGAFGGQPPQTALYGNVTWAADISQYRTQLIALTRPDCANEVDDDGDTLVDWPADPGCASELDGSELPDQDGDGVDDPFDNCLARKNPTQVDTDLDGCGDFCDFDWNNDGTVSNAELNKAAKQVGSAACGSPACPGPPFNCCVCDFNQDWVCTNAEINQIDKAVGTKPGPSGITNVVCDPARCTCTPAP
jgi:hypothetical protein